MLAYYLLALVIAIKTYVQKSTVLKDIVVVSIALFYLVTASSFLFLMGTVFMFSLLFLSQFIPIKLKVEMK